MPQKKVKLFCFPYAGSGPSAFRNWQVSLAPEFEVQAVSLPGREVRSIESMPDQIGQLVDILIKENLSSIKNCDAYALFGYSMGAIVAYEMLNKLNDANAPMPYLTICAASSPPHLLSKTINLISLNDNDLLKIVNGLGGIPKEVMVEHELVSLVVAALRSDFSMLQSYFPKETKPFQIPFLVYYGLKDTLTKSNTIDEWSKYTSSIYDKRQFPGGHFFINECRNNMLAALKYDLRYYLNGSQLSPRVLSQEREC